MKKVLFVFICLIAIYFTTGCGNDKKEAQAKLCRANMMIMQGCIELYNMDHRDMIETPTFEMFKEGGIMRQKKYLKEGIKPASEKCKYLFKGNFAKDGTISCEFHGTVKNIDSSLKK
jgi:competence protein ComGC